MQVFSNNDIIHARETPVLLRVHMFAVKEKKIGEINNLAELSHIAYSACIYTDMVTFIGAILHEFNKKISSSGRLTTAEGDTAFRVGIKNIVTVNNIHNFFYSHQLTGHHPGFGRADIYTETAVFTL